MTDTHLVAYMQGCHVGGTTASTLAATLALFNLVGTFVAGLLTDRIDARVLLAVVYLSRGAVLLVLPLLGTPALLAPAMVLYGLADFSSVPPTTALARTAFRTGGWSIVLGLIGAAHQVGAALGAGLGGFLYDRTGSYAAFFLVGAGTCVAAAALSLAIGRAGPRADSGAWAVAS